jgi:hypothetical protein
MALRPCQHVAATAALVTMIAGGCAASRTVEEADPTTGTGTDLTTTTVEATTTTVDISTTVEPTTTVAATDPPTTEPPEPAGPRLVVTGGGDGGWLPLVTWDGSAWQPAGYDDSGNPIPLPAVEGTEFQVFSVDSAPTPMTAGPNAEACFDGQIGVSIPLDAPPPEPPGFGFSRLAVSGDADPLVRPVQLVGLDVPEYQTIGERFAAEEGVDGTTGDVVQVVRADLDGDGAEEVLVVFERAGANSFGEEGDFSIVYLRKPSADGSVADSVVFSSAISTVVGEEGGLLGRARVLGVGDVNGDGDMEVALHWWYYEGAGVQLLELDTTGALAEVANAGCGA